MSISTKTGDKGTTALMFGRRVKKNHPRIEASGVCDELNAALGMAKALQNKKMALEIYEKLHQIQLYLVDLMGEISCLPEDRARYQEKGFHLIGQIEIDTLTRWVEELESQNLKFEGWATPGSSIDSAALEMARTICRRAERSIVSIGDEAFALHNKILVFLNRLSDLLWLMARKIENK